LCYARFVKHRSTASELIEAGCIRINRAKILKPSHVVKPSDILTIAMHDDVRVIRVLAEAERRGPAPEARQLYEELISEALTQNLGA
jgi:ribosome-associated heat shock protein Hsp15